MLNWLLGWLVLSVSIYLIALIFPGIKVRGFKNAIGVAAVYSLLNFLLFRVLIFITFPLLILKYLTLGLFGILINAVLLLITDKVLDGFEVRSFGAACVAAAGISLVNLVLHLVLGLPF